jgi:hypothetical protein
VGDRAETANGRVRSHLHSGAEYFGIPLLFEYVLRLPEKSGAPGVLDTRELGWPLLRSEDRIEDVRWHAG